MGTLNLSGSIVIGAQGAGDCSGSGTTNISFGATPAQLSAPVSAYNVLNVNSPNSFQALPGIGSTSAVTQGGFLFIRTKAAMMLRLVYYTGSGNVTVDVPVCGPFIWQVPSSNYLVSASIQGTGQVEVLVSGNQ